MIKTIRKIDVWINTKLDCLARYNKIAIVLGSFVLSFMLRGLLW